MVLSLGVASRNHAVPKGLGSLSGGELEMGDVVESVIRLAWSPHKVY